MARKVNKVDAVIPVTPCDENIGYQTPGGAIFPLPKKPIKVNNVRSAKRLLSRIITGFQRGELDGQDAKTMAYLLSVFVMIVKETEFEERLSELEKKINQTEG